MGEHKRFDQHSKTLRRFAVSPRCWAARFDVPLASFPGRCSLFKERPGSLCFIGCSTEASEDAGLDSAGLLDPQAFALVHSFEAPRDGKGSHCGDGGGKLATPGKEALGRMDLVHQAEAKRLCCTHHLSRKQQLERRRGTDEPGQPLRPPVPGNKAQLDLRLAQASRLAREAHGAGKRKLAPAAEREAVHQRDHRLAAGL